MQTNFDRNGGFYKIKATTNEREFIGGYLEALLFADGPEDSSADVILCAEFERESVIDCLAFYGAISCYLSDDTIVSAGRDFWYTRNGHGVGFWDRPELYGEHLAEKFTARAESFGAADPLFVYRETGAEYVGAVD